MRRALGIIGIIAVWAGITAYIVFASRYSAERRSEVKVTRMHITVPGNRAGGTVTPSTVSRWIEAGGVNPTGRPVGEIDVHAIRSLIAKHSEVRSVSVWTDLDGLLNIEVNQRRPVMRVRSSNGYRFWMTDDNYILPDRGDFTAYVPVVTGSMPFPFGTPAEGSYDGMIRRNYEDFLGQYTVMEAEARSLAARRDSVRSEIRGTRIKRSKRFWSKSRKEQFAAYNKQRIAELTQEAGRIDISIAALASKKSALREKEKKSSQSYNFLTKLVNFVKSVENDDFWSSQIVQINILGGSRGDAWHEPDIELIPRAGDHIILLGELDGNESERLDRLKTFYRNAVWHEGWGSQRYINIKYRGQIVCSR